MILTCDRRYNTFDLRKISKHYIEDPIFKTLKIKKSVKKILKGVKNNQKIVKKMFFSNKISKTFDFFGQKSKKKVVMFFSVLLYGITQLS